jgi:hypothetical protein
MTQKQIMSALLDGPKSNAELQPYVDDPERVAHYACKMLKAGTVTRVDGDPAGPGKGRRAVYAITDKGRERVATTMDWRTGRGGT